MKLHFYGTGASEGFPAMCCECAYCREARKQGGRNIRTRTGAQVDEDLLIDFSMDHYAHVAFGGLDMSRVESVLITHSHEDHFLPINLVTAFPPMAEYARAHTFHFYGNQKCERLARQVLDRWDEPDRYVTFSALRENETVQIGKYRVTPYLAVHDPHEDCFIYAIEKGGKTLLFGHDSAMFTEDTWRRLAQHRFDCVVLDCTSIMQRNAFASHMSFWDDVEIRQRMIASGMATSSTRFLATHFAHAFDPQQDRLEAAFAPYGIAPAYDGMDVEF